MKLTQYEKARIIGARALQIAMGAPVLIKMTKKDFEKLDYNPIRIAKKEFEKQVLPITIKRPMP
jgi:DNA-directed RNA polymerase subunit K/omega